MLRLGFLLRPLMALVLVGFMALLGLGQSPAYADSIDPYVKLYLRATEPVPIKLNEQGETRLISPEALSTGKRLFEDSCINCHVGGATLPDPTVSLALETLKGATPPRDNIENFIAYMRQPMTYDGEDFSLFCREVPESWMADDELGSLAAFVLRAAEKAPGWGTESF